MNSSPLPPSTESKINDFPFYTTFPSLEGGRGIFRLGPSESSSRLSRHAKGCKAKRGKRGRRRSNYPRNQICLALLLLLLFPWAENPKFGWLRFPRRRTKKAPDMKFEDSKFNFVLFFDFFWGGGRFDVFCEILASSLPLSIPRGRCS